MTWTVTVLEDAEMDLIESADWYEECDLRLRAGFLLCVDAAFDRIARNPFTYPRIDGEFRRAMIHRFPFWVIYRVFAQEVFIVAVAHASRHPRNWRTQNH